MVKTFTLRKELILIQLKHISKVYEGANRVEALKDISLDVKEGEIFGIIGQSGAGKSTLIRCINMLEAPTSGSVIVNGTDLTTLGEAELRKARKNIGMIFQHFNLLSSRTVYDNVAFPLELQGMSKAEIKDRIEPILEIVGLSDRINNYPSQLSGGQKQRVGIARALASNPKVLLCDEATSALDPQTTDSILKLLKDINEKWVSLSSSLHMRCTLFVKSVTVWQLLKAALSLKKVALLKCSHILAKIQQKSSLAL